MNCPLPCPETVDCLEAGQVMEALQSIDETFRVAAGALLSPGTFLRGDRADPRNSHRHRDVASFAGQTKIAAGFPAPLKPAGRCQCHPHPDAQPKIPWKEKEPWIGRKPNWSSRLPAQRPGRTTRPAIEALALVESDPELKAWWDARQAFDRRVAAKLEQVPVPTDLRENILNGRKIEQLPRSTTFCPGSPSPRSWRSSASPGRSSRSQPTPLARADYAAVVLPLFHDNAPHLAMMSPTTIRSTRWLKAQNAPMGTLPAR